MRICEHDNCGHPVFGTDKKTGKGWCKLHQWNRTDLKQKSISAPIKKKRKEPTGEGVIFDQITEERELVSFISGIPINRYEVRTRKCFAHVLSKAKNRYPKFKLEKENIVLLTWEEHHLFDHGSEKNRTDYAERIMRDHGVLVKWEKLHKLKEKLKEKYKSIT